MAVHYMGSESDQIIALVVASFALESPQNTAGVYYGTRVNFCPPLTFLPVLFPLIKNIPPHLQMILSCRGDRYGRSDTLNVKTLLLLQIL